MMDLVKFFFFFFHCTIVCRKSCRVRATLLQENEEEVVVEKSFAPKSFPGNVEGGSNGEPPNDSSSNGLEKWVIKLEQSVNILLTVGIAFSESKSCLVYFFSIQ